MNILYLCSDTGIPVLGRHGAAVHIRSLIRALAESDNRITLVAPLLNKSPWEQQEEVDATLIHLPASGETAAAAGALKAFHHTMGLADNPLSGEFRRILYNQEVKCHLQGRFAENPPDFIYERASLFGTAGVSLARAWSCPLVVELNAPLAGEQATYRGVTLADLAAQAERFTLSQADLVFVVSSPLREYALGLGVDPQRVHVVPNGVNPSIFRPRVMNGRRAPSAAPVLGFVGGLRPWHGVQVLPALLERLSAKHPSTRLIIAGDGPLRSELTCEFERRKLTGQVHFTGPVSQPEVADWIRRFDVALAPYPRPAHSFYFSPLKLFEYMACGVPVVAPQLGQIEELVREGETGILYPPDEFDALAAACDRILSEPELGRRLGQAAARVIQGRYTWDRNAARVLELVRSLPDVTSSSTPSRRMPLELCP